MKKLIVTFGGIGLVPGAPGTYASFAAAILYYLLWLWLGAWGMLVVAVLIVLACFFTVKLGPWMATEFRRSDPRQCVLDEAAGQWIALLFIPLTLYSLHPLSLVAAGFFLFRGFDVVKPYPISLLERLPGGWGVLMDDLAAGISSGCAFWVVVLVARLLGCC